MRERWSALVFLGLAVLWTWPAAVSDGLVGLQADAWSTAWVLHAAPRLLAAGGLDPLSSFPEGGDYRRLDSWVFAIVGLLGSFLAPARLHAWCAVLGTALSGWSAHALAVRCGARPPWSWIAGLAYAFSGINATVMIEGYAYFLLDPWLPLTALGAHRALHGQGSARDGAIAGLGWTLSLLTSAYVGLSASVLIGAFGIVALLRRLGRSGLDPSVARSATARDGDGPAATWRLLGLSGPEEAGGAPRRDRLPLPAILGFAAVAAVGLLLWGLPWVAGEDGQRLDVNAVPGSAALLAWGWAPTGGDAAGHLVTATLPTTSIALMAVAPQVLRREPVVAPLALTAALGFLLALGPGFALTPHAATLPLPLRLFDWVGIGPSIHFPARFLWLVGLGAGVVAALVATRLAARSPRAVAVLLGAELVTSFVGTGLPGRLRALDSTAPSAYSAARGPVLDLYPESELDGGLDIRTMAQACWYQTVHGRAIAENCVGTDARRHPRIRLGREVVAAVAEGRAPVLPGFAAIALHADWFAPADRARLMRGLTARLGPPVESRDGGEHLALFHLEDP